MKRSRWLLIMAAAFLLIAAGCAESGDDAKSPPGFEIPAGDTITTATEACFGCHAESADNGAVPVSVPHDALVAAAASATGNIPTINSVTISEVDEVTEVTAVADASGSLNNTWFSLYSAADATQYYVWYNVDAGGTDPAPGGTGIEVAIATGDTAADVGIATSAAVDAEVDFGAADDGTGVVTITAAATGVTTDADDGTAATGFAFDVTTQGGDEVLIDVNVEDETATAVTGLSGGDIRFTFASLVTDTAGGGGNENWVSYINNSSGVATYERVSGGGVFNEVGSGNYTYSLVTGYDIVGDGDTHRISMQVSSGIANPWIDFDPAVGAQTPIANPREIVLTDSCNECHAELGSTATGGGLAMHGSSRRDVEYCVTCHNPGSYDTDTGNTVDFKVLIHKIHSGKNLPSVQNGGTYQIIGYGGSVHDYSKGAFPQPVTNCDKCHSGADGANWSALPTQEACGSCHDDTSWADSTPTGMVKHAYGSTNFSTGLAQTDNTGCVGCHPATGSATGFAIENAHAWAQQVTLGQDYAYIIDSAVFDSDTDEVTVEYRVTDGGVDMDLDTGAWAVSGGASRLYLTVAWKPTGSADYTSPGSGSTGAPAAPLSFDLLCPVAATPCTPTTYAVTDNGDQTYTLVAELPSGATGTGIVSIEGHPAESIGGAENTTQNIRLPVANAQTEFVISGALETRRVVIDATKCENCHGGGVTGATVSMHGQNRTISAARDVTVCVICHNSANTDVDRRTTVAASDDGQAEQSIDFKHMIHRIHRGRDSEAGFIEVWGYGGSQHIFAGEFPPGNRFENCENCHVSGFSNEMPIAGGAHVEGTTIDSGADVSDHSDDLNISPNTALCSACHDSEGELVHMQVMGGNLSVLEEDILFY